MLCFSVIHFLLMFSPIVTVRPTRWALDNLTYERFDPVTFCEEKPEPIHGPHLPVDPGHCRNPVYGGLGLAINPVHGGLGLAVNPVHGGLGLAVNPVHDGLGLAVNPVHGGLGLGVNPVHGGLGLAGNPVHGGLGLAGNKYVYALSRLSTGRL